MKSNITITMTLAEVKDLRECTVVAMDCLKEQVSQMDGGSHEKDLAIHSYKKLEEFKNTLT